MGQARRGAHRVLLVSASRLPVANVRGSWKAGGVSHDYHDSHHADAIIFDGCGECDTRAADPIKALLHLDSQNYAALCARMRAVEFSGTEGYRSANEARVGSALYAIAVLEERHGSVGRNGGAA